MTHNAKIIGRSSFGEFFFADIFHNQPPPLSKQSSKRYVRFSADNRHADIF
jgi:hypothetical protein